MTGLVQERKAEAGFQEEVTCQLVLKGRMSFHPGSKGKRRWLRGKGRTKGREAGRGEGGGRGGEREKEHRVAGVERTGLDSGHFPGTSWRP